MYAAFGKATRVERRRKRGVSPLSAFLFNFWRLAEEAAKRDLAIDVQRAVEAHGVP